LSSLDELSAESNQLQFPSSRSWWSMEQKDPDLPYEGMICSVIRSKVSIMEYRGTIHFTGRPMKGCRVVLSRALKDKSNFNR
jgi:hypothetical protein